MNQDEVKNMNIDVILKPLEGAHGEYDVEEDVIYLDPGCPEELRDQVVYHEYVHKIDPLADNGIHGSEYVRHVELRAELGSKLIVGDNYVDDGYLDCLCEDPLELLDVIDEVDELLSSHGIYV